MRNNLLKYCECVNDIEVNLGAHEFTDFTEIQVRILLVDTFSALSGEDDVTADHEALDLLLKGRDGVTLHNGVYHSNTIHR